MRRLLASGTWLLGLFISTSLAWTAVHIVAGQVVGRQAVPLTPDAVNRALDNSPRSLPPLSLRSPSPEATTGSARVSRVSPSPSVRVTPGSTPTSSKLSSPKPSPSPSPTPTPTSTTKTYNLVGGTVTVRCEGNKVFLVAAWPKSGFSREIKKDGPEEVEVRFESVDEEDDRESRIEVTCSNGQPKPEIEEERD